MQRNEDGQRWVAPYLHRPPAHRAPDPDVDCPHHPGTRLVRVLGQRWICPTCTRDRT